MGERKIATFPRPYKMRSGRILQKIFQDPTKERRNPMSSNYQQKKMMNALGAIDTKGNIVLEQFQDGTALLFQPGNAQPFCVATDYDRATASWSYGKYFSDLGCAHEAAALRLSRTPASDGSRRISGKSSKHRISHRQNSTCSPSSWAIQGFGNVLSTGSSATT